MKELTRLILQCIFCFLSVVGSEKADIVFLQEVVPDTLSYLQDLLPQFVFVVGDTSQYFTATLLRRTTVHFDAHTIIPFPNTTMGRNLLSVQVQTQFSIVLTFI